ncbi:MAG TPA: hypothetical protein VEA18_02300 [Candidatus Kapabacteria bacterium]|nr:hypothetical protein [Candidatus Kapabacteria bacterium]
MKIFFTGRFNPRMAIRRVGYGELINPRSGQLSYTRRLGSGQFPRFHIYIEEKNGGMELHLHLDQKQPTYGDFTAHSGEYDGEVVEREAGRIQAAIGGPSTLLA